LVQAIL